MREPDLISAQRSAELAAELWGDKNVLRIDLGAVVSKSIGETEKNLEQVLEAARETEAVILFDEGEALFGKRTEVEDSHDRYSDAEVGRLLRRLTDTNAPVIVRFDCPHRWGDAGRSEGRKS